MTSNLFTLPAPAPHEYIVLVARDRDLQFLEDDLETSSLVHEAPDVVDHGRVAWLARTLVRLPETVPLQERPERDVVPPVEIHAHRPEGAKKWNVYSGSRLQRVRLQTAFS